MLRRFTRGLTGNTSMVHGDRENSGVKEADSPIRISALHAGRDSHGEFKMISTRRITQQQLRRSHAAARLAAERAAASVLRSASIMEARHGEIVDWLIRESGSTRVKAELEWQFVRAVTLEAKHPSRHRMEGRILSRSMRPRRKAGLIASHSRPSGRSVMELPHVSVAPLNRSGVGPRECGIVVKPACKIHPSRGGLLIAKIYEEAGLPPGLLNIVIGPHSEIGDQFTTHPIPCLISFCWSDASGPIVSLVALGGAALAAQAAGIEFLGEQQGCASSSSSTMPTWNIRYGLLSSAVSSTSWPNLHELELDHFVDASIYDEFVDRFIAHVKTLPEIRLQIRAIPRVFYLDPVRSTRSNCVVILWLRIESARKEGARRAGFPAAYLDRQVRPPHASLSRVTNDTWPSHRTKSSAR